MAIHTKDILWKGILEDLFADFLHFFYPNADDLFDMEKGFGFLDKELEELNPGTDIKHPVFVDKLVKVFTKVGAEEWILVHIEVQGYADKLFAQRMFTYFYRIRDKYNKEVSAIAILTDSNEHYIPDRYEYEFLGTMLSYGYKTYKIKGQDKAALERSDNPFASVILTVLIGMERQGKEPEDLLKLSTDLARNLFEKGFAKEKIELLFGFIRKYVHFGSVEESSKFDTEIDLITNKTRTMGLMELLEQMAIEEGIEKGMQQGLEQGLEQGIQQGVQQGIEKGLTLKSTELITNLLFETDFSVEKIARLANVEIDFVINVKNSQAFGK